MSHLTYNECLSMWLMMRERMTVEWHRIVNIHGALIVVMIFFAGSDTAFGAARVVVFMFYTISLIVTFLALVGHQRGLLAVHADLMSYPPPAQGGAVTAWVAATRVRGEVALRGVALVIVWVVVGYLLIAPLILGRT